MGAVCGHRVCKRLTAGRHHFRLLMSLTMAMSNTVSANSGLVRSCRSRGGQIKSAVDNDGR